MGKLVLTPHRLAFALYIILIAVHVALVIVWSKHYERRLVINDDSETLARLQRQAITVLVPQLFAILYLGAVLTLSQRLALSRANLQASTLTSLSDQLSAWNGFGAALIAIRDQFRLRTAFPQIICIAVYLGAFTALHVSTPALFSVDVFDTDMPDAGFTRTFTGLPLITQSMEGNVDSIIDSFFGTSQILPAYAEADLDLDTPGSEGALLYDYLIDTSAIYFGTANVNVTQFRVKCGTIPSATFAFGPGLTNWTISAPISQDYNVHLVDGVPPAAYVPKSFPYSSIRFPVVFLTTIAPDNISDFTARPSGPNLLFYVVSGANVDSSIRDSKGTTGPTFNYANGADTYIFQPIGCSISAVNGTGTVDTLTGSLSKHNLPPPPTDAGIWAEWVPEPSTGIDALDIWSHLFWPEASAPAFPTKFPCDPSLPGCSHPITVTELFVNDFVYGNTPNLTLAALEETLANVTGVMYWNERFETQTNNDFGWASITQTGSVSKLNLHTWPVFVGLACSILLLPLAAYLLGVRSPRTPDGKLETSNVGLLQLALGGGKGSAVADTVLAGSDDEKERVEGSDRPARNHGDAVTRLRKAGMDQVVDHFSSYNFF